MHLGTCRETPLQRVCDGEGLPGRAFARRSLFGHTSPPVPRHRKLATQALAPASAFCVAVPLPRPRGSRRGSGRGPCRSPAATTAGSLRPAPARGPRPSPVEEAFPGVVENSVAGGAAWPVPLVRGPQPFGVKLPELCVTRALWWLPGCTRPGAAEGLMDGWMGRVQRPAHCCSPGSRMDAPCVSSGLGRVSKAQEKWAVDRFAGFCCSFRGPPSATCTDIALGQEFLVQLVCFPGVSCCLSFSLVKNNLRATQTPDSAVVSGSHCLPEDPSGKPLRPAAPWACSSVARLTWSRLCASVSLLVLLQSPPPCGAVNW